jgi:hypothetical protein
MVEKTRYGSPRIPAASACSVLRSHALKSNIVMLPATTVDMAAASLAADAWAALTGTSTIGNARNYGKSAVTVLAACIARACGQPGSNPVNYATQFASSDDSLRLVSEHAAWATEMCPDASRLVLSRAASDLLAAGEETVYGRYAGLLIVVSQQI